MTHIEQTHARARQGARVFNGGFLWNRRHRRILDLAGFDLRLGKPEAGDVVLAWGHAGTSHRAERAADRWGAEVVRVEDAFLRSLHPGRAGEPTLGLVIDRRGAYFDARQPSDLEHILANDPLDDGALLARSHAAMDRIRRNHLTKYAAVSPDLAPPEPGYVLVVDQTRGDASVRLGGGSAAMFHEMLVLAQERHPYARIVIKTHPETAAGHRHGYYGPDDIRPGITLETRPISPQALLEGAVAVYTVSSQMGFEAIIAGHKPVVFGQPFYAGWGLTEDENPLPRRQRVLTRAQLFGAAMIRYPVWYDPYRDRLCEVEDVLDTLQAQARAWREDGAGYVATGMRLWKRRPLQRMLGREVRLRFGTGSGVADAGRPVLVWAGKESDDLRSTCAAKGVPLVRVEDGFLRSRGLGADLVPPLSLVLDEVGIYYDPTRASGLEACIATAAKLPDTALVRAERLRERVIAAGLSKYNLAGAGLPEVPEGARVVLVPGQVADDASLRLGATGVADNAALLAAVRAAHPEAFIIYKPHPDVEAGLREGAIDAAEADLVATRADPLALIARADLVATMTSTLGFEALIRGVAVETYGAPFYAGWGLTRDRGRVPARRAARPSLAALIHAVLIAYPRYWDPVTGLPCAPEVIVDRLATGDIPAPGPANRALAKLQGAFASMPWLWR